MATQKVQTVVIDNFSGEITSELLGTLNSGKCPIYLNPSGKLPISNQFKSTGLQFCESNYAITGSAFTATMLHTGRTIGSGGVYSGLPIVFGVAMDGSLYEISVASPATPTPDTDTAIGFVGTAGVTLNYGGGMFYDPVAGTNGTLVIGGDDAVSYSTNNPLGNPSSASFTLVGTATFTASMPRPMAFFLGNLYVGDGNKLAQLNSTYTSVANASVLNPTIPPGYRIRNLQVSPDGRYLIITASVATRTTDFNISSGQQPQYQPLDTVVLQWNGSDPTYSSLQVFKGLNIVSINSSSTDMIMFAKNIDGFGIYSLDGSLLASISDVSEPNNNFASYPPLIYSVDAIGKLFFFMFQMGTSLFIYLFDASTNKIYSILQDSLPFSGSIAGGLSIASLHANSIVSNVWVESTRSKLYYFYKDNNFGSPIYRKFAVHLQNYGGFVSGAYATQIQEFERKVKPVKMRVYILSSFASVQFIARLYDSNLNNLTGNKTYTYSAGTDLTQAQGALTKVEFSISSRYVNGFGLNITPSTSLSFFVERVEIDYVAQENPTSN